MDQRPMYCGRRRLDLELMWADADGRKLALQCAQHGANVVLGARSPGFLNDVATEIAHAGGDAIAVPCDVTQQHERRALIDGAVARFGRIDGLVNSAFRMTVWSLMTALCGMAQNFVQFVLARMGVGLGEAGFTPAAHSLISDLYPVERRPFAMGLFALGVPLGIMLGMVIGGVVAEHAGWRAALMIVGAPGCPVRSAGARTAARCGGRRCPTRATHERGLAHCVTYLAALLDLRSSRAGDGSDGVRAIRVARVAAVVSDSGA